MAARHGYICDPSRRVQAARDRAALTALRHQAPSTSYCMWFDRSGRVVSQPEPAVIPAKAGPHDKRQSGTKTSLHIEPKFSLPVIGLHGSPPQDPVTCRHRRGDDVFFVAAANANHQQKRRPSIALLDHLHFRPYPKPITPASRWPAKPMVSGGDPIVSE